MLLQGRIVGNGGVRSGWIETRAERISDAGTGAPPRAPDLVHDGFIAPGLFDLQVNGAAGVVVTDGAQALSRIERALLAHGVTRCLATVITSDHELAAQTLRDVEARMRDPASPIAGAHLEGPFLSPAHAGMHRPELLRSPSDAIPSYYSSPAVKLVTLAPELPGALELIHELRERGVAVALGHSGASAEEARAAVDAGARLITHLFNGMAPLHHRGPGLAGVALSDERLSVSVIADGVHVDPLVLRLVERLAGDRVVLVSDAGPLASSDADSATLGGVTISRAADGASQTADGRLAGSAILLDEAVRRWGDYTGATLAQAIQAASDRPARALGLATGLEPGASADLILLDDRGRLERTMHNGGWTD